MRRHNILVWIIWFARILQFNHFFVLLHIRVDLFSGHSKLMLRLRLIYELHVGNRRKVESQVLKSVLRSAFFYTHSPAHVIFLLPRASGMGWIKIYFKLLATQIST
jgi:hypothetical protein